MQFDLGGSLGSRTSLQIARCASSWEREMQLAPSLGKPSEPSTKPRPLPAPQPVLTDRTEAATSFTQAVLTCSGEAFGTPAAFNTRLANRDRVPHVQRATRLGLHPTHPGTAPDPRWPQTGESCNSPTKVPLRVTSAVSPLPLLPHQRGYCSFWLKSMRCMQISRNNSLYSYRCS